LTDIVCEPVPKHHVPPAVNRGSLTAQALDRGAFALRMGQFAEAERLAAEVLRSSRTNAAAVSILARALIAQNRAGEAIAPLERSARRSSDEGIATLLGAALGSAGRRAEAIEQLRRTVARRPPFLPAFQELAGQLAAEGRFEEAIAVIEGGLVLAPKSIDLQLDLARLHLHRNERGKARKILFEAHEVEPGRTDILQVLARILLLDGEHAAAVSTCRRVLALRPDDAMTRADLAACLFEMGDREGGEANLRLAMKGRPQMLGRATYALVQSSHGRFFFRQSAFAEFLQRQKA
jgi:tetratricopeptide (TPR) repeat protein